MKFFISITLVLITSLAFVKPAQACSPCGTIVIVNENLVGNTLVLDLIGNPGWSCTYTMLLEIVCANTPFTGNFTHSTTTANAGGFPGNVNVVFPTINVDLTGYCPGTYNIQAWMNSCGVGTAVQLASFTIPGAIGLGLIATPAQGTVCPGESIQLDATATGGCNGGAVSFSWAGAGLSNSNISNPVATPGATTTYTVTATAACYTETADVTIVVLDPSTLTASAVDDICSSGIGEVTANPDPGGTPVYSYFWPPPLNANTQTVTGVFAGNYTVEMTDGNGCVSTANVVVGDNPAAFQGSTTLVSCPGGSDGTAFAEMIPVLGNNITYLWDDPAAQTTQTATGLSAGAYSCTVTSDIGCLGVVNVNVTEIPGMIGNIVNQTDVTCNSGSDGSIQVNVIQGTAPYSYAWDNSSSTANTANDLSVGQSICTVTDAFGCKIDIVGVLNEPPPLQVVFITPSTQICPEADIQLDAIGQGGSSPYIYTWYENGTLIGTGVPITVDPDVTNTEYCVVLSEECGSPTADSCTLIYFPTPIQPSAVPDKPEKCVPDVFEFFNTSINAAEIATTFWEFDLNPTHVGLELGDDSTSFYYYNVGTYDIIMTVTSIYGCVYTDTMWSLINVLPNPVADFGFSVNPTNIFETSQIQLQDKSSFDVIDWQYYSSGSIPTSSTNPNPYFDFPEGFEGDYPITLIVTTELGCTDTVTLIMQVINDVTFFAPNAFTPDDDEFNQLWKPWISGIDVYDFELFVFNRWGEIVWESHDPSIGWDGTFMGKIVETGAYPWKATVKKPYVDERITFSGFVSVLK